MVLLTLLAAITVGIIRMRNLFAVVVLGGIYSFLMASFTLVTVKLAIIMVVILFTSPIATHALAQAALQEGLEPVGVGNKVLVGPGAHSGPEKIGKALRKKSRSASKNTARKLPGTSAAKRKPASRTARSRKAASTKRRTRS